MLPASYLERFVSLNLWVVTTKPQRTHYLAPMDKYFLIFSVLFLFIGCKEPIQKKNIELISSQIICENCQSPNLHLQSDGRLLVSYIQSENDSTDQLIMHRYSEDTISDPALVATGSNWFVNWADIPSLVSLDKSGSKIMAHWLQMSAKGTYDYDVVCAISTDGMQTSGIPFILHDDAIAAEHGFVTMISDENGAFVTWLDGRNTKTPINDEKSDQTEEQEQDNHEHGHGHGGTLPMTLRASWIDGNGKKTNDLEIDNRVCDCCQTDAVMTNSGPIVVYRDRSETEIRDISIAKFKNEKWSSHKVHNDNWQIAGCPVNGPTVAYENGLLAVAWYTEMNGSPKVYLATSIDDGDTFSQPILIDGAKPFGRVDVSITKEKHIVVTWVGEIEEKSYIIASIIKDGLLISDAVTLIETSPSRSSGFPIIELADNHLIIIRTISEDEALSVELTKFEIL